MATEAERGTVNNLTRKQSLFVDFYIQTLNATESARLAQYANPNKSGPRLLQTPSVEAEIESRLAKHHASAEEVLAVLSNHMRGSLGDFLDIDDETGEVWVDLKKAKAEGKLGLLKKVTPHRRVIKNRDGDDFIHYEKITLELHDAQAAAEKLGRYHKLFTDKTELTGKDGESLQPNVHIYLPHNGRDNLGDDE